MDTQTVTTPPPIKKIILKNIQCYKDAEIELPPPGEMCVLIGPSDGGKTTLGARSQLKLGFDSYSTKKMIRRGTKKGYISYIYDTPDNLTVSWCFECPVDRATKKPNADKAKAWWEIVRDVEGVDSKGNPNKHINTLEGGGKGVPEAIQQITGMRPVQIGKEKINFNVSEQLAGPFMGGKTTPNDRYRILGILAGTLEVDQAVKQVSTEIIQARREETKLEKEIKGLDEQVGEYDWLEVLGADIEKVEAALNRMRAKRELREKLLSLKENIEMDLSVIQGAGEHIAVLTQWIDNAESILVDIEVDNHTHQKLTAALAGIVAQKETISRAEESLKATQNMAALQTALPGVELKNNTFRGLVNLDKQIAADKESLIEAERVISLTVPAPEVSMKVSALSGKQITHTTLKGLKINIQSENIKLTLAQKILTTTQTHKMASEACERLGRLNHTRSLLVQSRAVISKAREDKKRYAEMVEKLAGVEQVRGAISRFGEGVARGGKLKGLAREIVGLEKERARAEVVMNRTAEMREIRVGLVHFLKGLDQIDSLKEASGKIRLQNTYKSIAQEKIGELDEKIETARAEYRELLLKAGICEGCRVVDAVMAAS